ncbi:methyltransferase TYW3-domain-containing protein [Phaeosphaeria sp. MPI-PUGE-AT-0046c]|nr:methyltransferase TYW3-domain-containing protein [Phaeosphaeria sp. MPI-PUGE-AT-0046c]
MTSRFELRKQNILAQLGAPDGEYHDLSPKGSVDEPIRELIDEINDLAGLVTTSSCSGRISVFLEGRKSNSTDAIDENGDPRAGPGGKGGGGAWLYISHASVETPQANEPSAFSRQFGFTESTSNESKAPGVDSRYIHLKFEPMILHILTASIADAQLALAAALSAGFRESGAVSLGAPKSGETTPIVAVRSTGYSFDSVIGYQNEHGVNTLLVDERYLRTLVAIANDRFRINTERIARFRKALLDAFRPSAVARASQTPDWEDADVRKQRKREEGLARQRALQIAQSRSDGSVQADQAGESSVDDLFQ